jgi:TRAP-type C4-dicarboxylate transport system permease small subunit
MLRETAVVGKSGFGAWLFRFDTAWTQFESILCAAVLVLEVAAFTFWIVLKGLSATSSTTSHSGLIFRAVTTAIVFGILAYRFARRQPPRRAVAIALAASAAGLVVGRASGNAGAGYFSNLLNWQQDSSWLTLLGGLRGVGTELTWWLAMVGASLATGGGKHINIDALLRFLRPRLRVPAILVGWVMSAVVCFAGVWGFFDHIAIGSFGAPADAPAGEKISLVMREGGRHMFLLRRQLSLDLMTASHVLKGERYDGWLRGAEWNTWLAEGGWDAYYSEQELAAITMPESAAAELHPPLVVGPTGHSPRGMITRDLHLIFPFGLLMIGIRFVVRVLLVLLGQAKAESDPHAIASAPKLNPEGQAGA